MIGEGPLGTAEINTQIGALIIDELARLNTPHFCVAPGARCAPLTAALALRPALPQSVFTDERCAGFFALGVSKATKRPAVMITTSGTAISHALPAAIEADRSETPLLLISADRPPELHDTGANQAIDQIKLFANVARWQVDIPAPDSGFPPQALLTTLNQAVHRATASPNGPVHINIQFREPLGAQHSVPGDLILADRRGQHRLPWTTCHHGHSVPSAEVMDGLCQQINNVTRGLVVIGAQGSDFTPNDILKVTKKLGWPVYADAASGCHGSANTIQGFDYLLDNTAFCKQAQPEMILHFGGSVTSKRYLRWLADYCPAHHVVIRNDPRRQDPSHTVSMQITAHSSATADLLLPRVHSNVDTQWRDQLLCLGQAFQAGVHRELGGQLSEPSVVTCLAEQAAKTGSGLFIGNSMPIRDLDVFAGDALKGVVVAANRGASGIGGSISTACGWATGLNCRVIAIIGDQSAFHDMGALMNLRDCPQPIQVVVINNGGGGIFSFLPVHESAVGFDSHFANAHNWDLQHTSAAFNVPYQKATDITQVNEQLQAMSDVSGIIEVQTNREDNLLLHKNMLKLAHQAITQQLG